MTIKKTDWVPLGFVARPFGVLGAVKLHLSNANSQTLREGLRVRLENSQGRSIEVTIAKVRPDARVDIREFVSCEEAELWVKAQVLVQREDFPILHEKELYLVDLLNAEVRTTAGEVLGTIIAFSDNRAQPLAIVQTALGKKVSVPFVSPLVQTIHREEGVVILDPPEGLF